MRDIDRQELEDRLGKVLQVVEDGLVMLQDGCRTPDFIRQVCDRLEAETRLLRADVIRHTRLHGKGLRHNGEPDRRFSKHRTAEDRMADLRFSRVG